MVKKSSVLALVSSVMVALFAAGCGGGGGSTAAGSSSPTLTGLAATGAGIANGTVTARCVSGPVITGTTDGAGVFTLNLGSSTAPCMVQVTGGTPAVTLYSFAESAGRVNITPATDLLVSRALGADPGTQFTSFDASKGTTISNNLGTAKTYVNNQLNAIAGATLALDPLTGAFAVGDADDKVLDALGAAMQSAGKTIAQLRPDAVANTSLSTAVPAFLGIPANPVATANSATQITLTWATVPGATSYKVFRAATSGAVNVAGVALATPATNSYVDAGLTAATSYFYKVVAVNSVVPAGGAASAEATATTNAAGGSGLTCDTSKFAQGAAVAAPTSQELASFARTYTGSEGDYGVNPGDPFVASGSATLVLNSNGSATYNGASYAPTSYCLETIAGGTQLVINSGAMSHFDLKADGTWSGYTSGGKVVTNAAYTGGGAGTGLLAGLNPTHGTVGSTVTIVGSGFGSSPQVKFYDAFMVFGTLISSEVAATVVSSSDTQIVVTVPTGADTGVVKVNGTSMGTFTVDLPVVGAWTQQDVDGGYSVATNGSKFVKVWSLSNVKQSTTGTSWNDSYAYASLNYMGGQVQWDGSQFVYMVSKDATSSPVQTVAVSSDGTNWTTKVAGQKLISWDQQYASSMRDFIAVSGRMTLVGDKGGIATSTDGGTNWTLETYPVGYQDHQILAVDDTGSQRIALTLSSDGGVALRSNSGGAWSAVATGLDLKPTDLLWTGTTHVATGATTGAGGGARVLRSSDGQTWTAVTLPSNYASGSWRGAKLVKHGSNLWLLVHKLTGNNATGAVLLKSTDDGQTWALDTDFGSDTINALAFGTNIWIAIGNRTYTRAAP